jgi:hypothetical protein
MMLSIISCIQLEATGPQHVQLYFEERSTEEKKLHMFSTWMNLSKKKERENTWMKNRGKYLFGTEKERLT